jgi:hypothetical protein
MRKERKVKNKVVVMNRRFCLDFHFPLSKHFSYLMMSQADKITDWGKGS